MLCPFCQCPWFLVIYFSCCNITKDAHKYNTFCLCETYTSVLDFVQVCIHGVPSSITYDNDNIVCRQLKYSKSSRKDESMISQMCWKELDLLRKGARTALNGC